MSEQKPLSQMTKTELEMQDTSWQNIGSFMALFGVIILGTYLYEKYKKK
jgi:hypothetical protein